MKLPKPKPVGSPVSQAVAQYEEAVAQPVPSPEEEAVPTVDLPSTMGECIDLLYQKRAARLVKQKELKEAQADEDAIKEYILQTFGDQNLDGAKGKIATASITRYVVPVVNDWHAVYDYILRTGAWELLERRMTRVAYRERLEQGEEVPGTEPLEKVDLSLTKAGGGRR